MPEEKPTEPELDIFADLEETLEVDEVISVDNLLMSIYQYEDWDDL